MPILDFLCKKCQYTWEDVVLSKDDEPLTCPKCHSSHIERLISWRGMYTGEHKKAWDRPPPSNPTSVYIRRDKK